MPSTPSTGTSNARHAHPAPAGRPRKALLIVNPQSRRGGEADLQVVVNLLQASGYTVIRRQSKNAAECSRVIDEHCADLDLVIVAGGDGTVSSVAATLYRHQKPLAILPLGTANDLARSLSISDDLASVGQLVVDEQLRWIDLGRVNGHFFFNAVNIGLGTQVTRQLSREGKRTWGAFSYLKALWETLARKREFRAEIKVDGRRYRQRSIHITVGNGRYYGGGNVVDEEAQIDSGKLCLYSIKPQQLLSLVFLAPLLRLGKQRLAKRTLSEVGRKIEINTSPRLEIHADGERIGFTPATLEVIPGALAVYAPLSEIPSTAEAASL